MPDSYLLFNNSVSSWSSAKLSEQEFLGLLLFVINFLSEGLSLINQYSLLELAE
jgi:hypothetical protein